MVSPRQGGRMASMATTAFTGLPSCSRPHVVLICVGILIIISWPFANFPRLVALTMGIRQCDGPVLDPAPRLEPWSRAFADKLAAEMKQFEEKGQGLDIIFLGDSITETWRGTDMGRDCSRCEGVPAVFQEYFLTRYPRTEVLAVGGDQVSHLEWRLRNGEMPIRHGPKVFVIMIGTNDLGAAACNPGVVPITEAAAGVTSRIQRLLDLIHDKQPASKVLLLGILPRGGQDDKTFYDWPSKFTPAMQLINGDLASIAQVADWIDFMDCSHALLPGGTIDPKLMPDALHPRRDGMELLAECIVPSLEKIFGSSRSRG